MNTIEEGHTFFLHQLDDFSLHSNVILQFVARMGPKYPGNITAHPGTNLQEVFRACLERLFHLNRQERCWQNIIIIRFMWWSIWLLEWRAAKRHNRKVPPMFKSVYGSFCLKCGHVGCKGDCHV